RLSKRVFSPKDAAFDPRAIYAHPTMIRIEGGDASVQRRVVIVLVGGIFGGPILMVATMRGSSAYSMAGFGTGVAIVLGRMMYNLARVDKAGPPLVRLPARSDVRSLFSIVAVGYGCLTIGWSLQFAGDWMSIGLGMVCGALAVYFLELLVRERIDLCEN